MLGKDAIRLNRRARLKRLALAAFLGFCMISAVMHFTIGSIIALLFPGHAPPPEVASAISILTITRLTPEERATFERVTTEHQRVAQRDVQQPVPKEVVHQQLRPTFEKTQIASITTPRLKASRPTSARTSNSSARSFIETVSPNGFNPQQVQPNVGTGNGAPGTGAAEDPGDPGKDMPTGAVWSEQGPAGSGSSGGGIILEGGGGGGGHDSCAPSRGGFFYH
ncbi:MAG: hypothetical protein JO009_06835 [Candidatus Eremiobacteraeota bacterium]|nr:hypothetical protein [Candidatus Eremiobacteraeota bacterium]MBV8671128.1 hypothetical protein [Candidatus Eremiobacteraeota bacterium]